MVRTMSYVPTTYFGLWSAKDIQRVSALLSQLEVRFEINEYEASQEMLEDWCAWDDSAASPNTGFDLWIFTDDLDKVGYKIVEMFPERKFNAD